MAIQKTHIKSSGLELTNAFWHIDTFISDRKSVIADLGIYVSKQDFLDGKRAEDTKRYKISGGDDDFLTYFSIEELDKENVNPVSQTYKYLMELPEFNAAKAISSSTEV